MKMTAEERAQRAEVLRQRIAQGTFRRGNRGPMTAEEIARHTERLRMNAATGTGIFSPQAREAHRAATSTPEERKRRAEFARSRVHTREEVEQHAAKKRGRLCTHEKTRKGPNHFNAKTRSVIDPSGKRWEVTNMIDFVRSHPELFEPKDLIPRKLRVGRLGILCGKTSDECNASSRLSGMFTHPTRFTWKGWTAIHECTLTIPPSKANVVL